MPTYVYKFVETGETIEVQQSFTDDALTEATHPQTGAVLPVKKVFTPVGVTFKGGGFYKTDSRGKSSSGRPPSESKGDGAGSSSSESSSSDSTSTAAPSKSEPASTTSSSSSSTTSSTSSD